MGDSSSKQRLQRIVLYNVHVSQQHQITENENIITEIHHARLEIDIELEQDTRFITIWTLLHKMFEHHQLANIQWSYFIYGENDRQFDAQVQQGNRYTIEDLDTVIELQHNTPLTFQHLHLNYTYCGCK